MSKITDIRDVAASSKGNLSDALLQCLVLADELGYDPLMDWANQELSGYPDFESLPEYRKTFSSLTGTLFEGARYTQNFTIPDLWIEEEHRDRALTVPIYDGIPKLLTLPDNGTMGVAGLFINQVEGRINNQLRKKYGARAMVRGLTLSVPSGTYAAVIGAVQHRIVRFMIELNRLYPSDMDIQTDSGEHKAQMDRVFGQLPSIGPVTNLVIANRIDQVNQSPTTVRIGDFRSLADYLRGLDVSDAAIAELEPLAKEVAAGNESEEAKQSLREWIGEQVSEIPEAAGEIAAEGTRRALTTAIFEGLKEYAPKAWDWLREIDVPIDMLPM